MNTQIKQIIRSYKRAISYQRANGAMLIICTLAIFVFAVVVGMLSGDISPDITLIVMGGSTVLSSLALIGNIEDVPDRDVAGEQLGYELVLIGINQIEATSFPKPNSNRELGQIPFKPGEKPIVFQAHQVLTSDSTGERGDLSTKNTNKLTIIMGGNGSQLLNFIEQYAGGKFIVLYKECDSDNYLILGTPTRPMVLKSFERNDNLEKRAVTLNFENTAFRLPCIYVGSIDTMNTVILTAGASSLPISSSAKYVIPNGTAATTPITAVSGITNNDKGRIIVIEGTGTDKASTIEDGAVFILEDGNTWSAKVGSRLTLRIVDTSRLVEVPGTRIQTT